MITNSLGNTLTDISDDVSSGNYIHVAPSLITGLMNGDGWAYMLAVTAGYLAYRLVSGAKSTVKSTTTKRRKAKAVAKDIDEQIQALQKRKKGR